MEPIDKTECAGALKAQGIEHPDDVALKMCEYIQALRIVRELYDLRADMGKLIERAKACNSIEDVYDTSKKEFMESMISILERAVADLKKKYTTNDSDNR